jgi:hypothetical protein
MPRERDQERRERERRKKDGPRKTDGEQTSPRRKKRRQAQVLPAFDFNGISNT